MNGAIWIIAICEVVRVVQVMVGILLDIRNRKTLNNEFVESLKKSNREWAVDLLEEFLKGKQG